MLLYTLTAHSRVLGLRETASGKTGVAWVRSTGTNQRGETVLGYLRWVMVRKREPAAPAPDALVPDLLDAVEPEANASLHPATLRAMGIEPGEMIEIETRRGAIRIMARADRAIAEDMVFVPFAYVEAAANVLTNPQLDPYGKIPEFKFAACRVAKVGEGVMAAE